MDAAFFGLIVADVIAEPVDLAVCDVSFISVTLILPALGPVLQPAAEMVILVKPQFEVGRDQVGKGGIVRDPELHRSSCERVESAVRPAMYATMNQTVTLRKTAGGWKVAAFENTFGKMDPLTGR